MKGMNISNDVFTAVRSNLFSSLRNIRKDVYNNNLKISHTSNSLSLPSPPLPPEHSSQPDLQTLHIINGLKNDEKYLKNSLFALTQNELLLKNESFTSLNQHSNNNSFSVDKTLLKVKLSRISEVKTKLNKRLTEVSHQIDKLLYQENKKNKTYGLSNEKLRCFLTNIEQNKMNYNPKLNEMHKESQLRKMKMLNEVENKLNTKQQELLYQEKLNQAKQQELLYQKRIQEKERIQERTRQNSEKLLKLKPYINNVNKCIKYSYIDNRDQYEQNEEELLYKENIRRKERVKHIDVEEFREFGRKVDEMKYKAEEESLNKARLVKEMWGERSKLKPAFVPSVYYKVEEDMTRKQIEMNKKKERAKLNRNLQMEYSIKKVPLPKVYLKDIDEENENDENNGNNKDNIHVKTLTKSQSSKIINMKYQHYLNPIHEVKKYQNAKNGNENKRKPFSYSLQNTDENKNENVKKFIMERLQKYKPKIKDSYHSNKKVEPLEKQIDYLAEERIKKQQKRIYGGVKEYNGNEKHPAQKEIKKIFDGSKGTLDENIYLAKNKMFILEEQVKQKEQLLKVSGGIIANPDLGNEVCDLMIDSIKAKLSILGEMNVNGE